MGFRVADLEFGVWGLGFAAYGVQGLGLRAQFLEAPKPLNSKPYKLKPLNPKPEAESSGASATFSTWA